MLRLPLPDGIPLQMIAVHDIGTIAASALLDPSAVPAEIEIAGDELTGSEIAAAFATRTGMPARYEALPISAMDGQGDMQAMFRWFAETPAFQADLDAVRELAPEAQTFAAWLDSVNYTPAS